MHLACAHLSAINRRLTLLDAILSYLEHTWVAHTAASSQAAVLQGILSGPVLWAVELTLPSLS